MNNWQEEVNFAITVCDLEGKILSMNKKSGKTFQKQGGTSLTGSAADGARGRRQASVTNILDCHPEPARSKLRAMLKKPFTNAYTIKKNGVKKLIYQTPWFKDGKPRGLVELSLELPGKLPHFIRK